jgi:hypothetical protein
MTYKIHLTFLTKYLPKRTKGLLEGKRLEIVPVRVSPAKMVSSQSVESFPAAKKLMFEVIATLKEKPLLIFGNKEYSRRK